MSHRVARRFGMTRTISLVLLLLGSAAVFLSVYQVVAGHSAFSWVWLMSLVAAGYGAFLFGTFALRGHLPAPLQREPTPEADVVG